LANQLQSLFESHLIERISFYWKLFKILCFQNKGNIVAISLGEWPQQLRSSATTTEHAESRSRAGKVGKAREVPENEEQR